MTSHWSLQILSWIIPPFWSSNPHCVLWILSWPNHVRISNERSECWDPFSVKCAELLHGILHFHIFNRRAYGHDRHLHKYEFMHIANQHQQVMGIINLHQLQWAIWRKLESSLTLNRFAQQHNTYWRWNRLMSSIELSVVRSVLTAISPIRGTAFQKICLAISVFQSLLVLLGGTKESESTEHGWVMLFRCLITVVFCSIPRAQLFLQL